MHGLKNESKLWVSEYNDRILYMYHFNEISKLESEDIRVRFHCMSCVSPSKIQVTVPLKCGQFSPKSSQKTAQPKHWMEWRFRLENVFFFVVVVFFVKDIQWNVRNIRLTHWSLVTPYNITGSGSGLSPVRLILTYCQSNPREQVSIRF